MRIATYSLSSTVISQISKLSQQQSELQLQVSTGQRVFLPEDDPAAVGRLLAIGAEQQQISQYGRNADRATEVSNATYAALNELQKVSTRAGELATLAASSSSDDAYKSYAAEVDQLIGRALQVSNSRFGNDYLFSGTAVDTVPFTATTDASGQTTAVSYVGNTAQMAVPVSERTTIYTGSDGATNTGVRDFMNYLVTLRDAMVAKDGAAVSAASTNLETSDDVIVNAISDQGAVQLRIEAAQAQQTSRTTNLEQLASSEADVDLATTLAKLNQTSTAYEAALAAAGKVMQLTILDYLR